MKYLATITALAALSCSNQTTTSHHAAAIEYAESTKIDLLVVVDTSFSMMEENSSIEDNFNQLITQLENAPGGLPSLHAAVITSDLGLLGGVDNADIESCAGIGDGAEFRAPQADCAGLTENVIRDEVLDNGSREQNFTGSWADAFACLNPPLGGCGFEQPLKAVVRALDGSNPGNGEFLRDDAVLAVVFITDEDDCSVAEGSGLFSSDEATFGPISSFRCVEFGLECDGAAVERSPGNYASCEPSVDPNVLHPDDVVNALTQLKGSSDDVMVAVIAGDPDGLEVIGDNMGSVTVSPSCNSASGLAYPGHRLAYFANQFTHSIVTSVCNADLSAALNSTAGMILAGLEDVAPDETDDDGDSGGCSTTGAGGSAFLLGFLALWLVGLGRKKRS